MRIAAALGSSTNKVIIDRNGSALMEAVVKNMAAAELVDAESVVSGGVKDVYGEDTATEDQLVTPWAVSVARYICFIFFWGLFLALVVSKSLLFWTFGDFLCSKVSPSFVIL